MTRTRKICRMRGFYRVRRNAGSPASRNAVVLALVLLAASCARTERQRPLVALVMKSLANEFFQTMERGAREHQGARPADYDLVVNGIKDEQDVARQVDIVEDMIARRVNAIVIA